MKYVAILLLLGLFACEEAPDKKGTDTTTEEKDTTATPQEKPLEKGDSKSLPPYTPPQEYGDDNPDVGV